MRTEYDVIFLGSSCFAMGCAAQRPGDCLVLESGEGFGPEFVDALRACGSIRRPEGPGAALYDELVARGVMDGDSAARGELHLPALNVVLNRAALELGLNMLFRARVIGRRAVPGGVELDAVCCARVVTLRCRRVIDTRSTDYDRVARLDPSARFGIAANLYAPSTPSADMNGMGVRRGFLPGEAFLTMPVNRPSPLDREALLRTFEARPDEWMEARLLRVAAARPVLCRAIREEEEGGLFIPGCGFDNPVAAWAAGLAEKEALA